MAAVSLPAARGVGVRAAPAQSHRRSLPPRAGCNNLSRPMTARFPERSIRCGATAEGELPETESSMDAGKLASQDDDGWVGGEGWVDDFEDDDEFEDDFQLPDLSQEDLLKKVKGSHYQFLGVSPSSSQDEIRSAYRSLSKMYHPDTTSLPSAEASKLFVKLRDVYGELSDPEKRSYYDWRLALEVVSQQNVNRLGPSVAGNRDIRKNIRPGEAPIDRLGVNEKVPLTNQATTALAFDLGVIALSVVVLLIVVIVQGPGSS